MLHNILGPTSKMDLLNFIRESTTYEQNQNDFFTWANLENTIKVKTYELIIFSLQMQSISTTVKQKKNPGRSKKVSKTQTP